MIYRSKSAQQTMDIAHNLATALKGGEVILLYGDLGAGKTVFSKGIAKGLDIAETVTSPTFTIINEYPAAMPFVHMDAYRLRNPEEIEDIGFSDYLTGYVVVIEWADMIEFQLPDDVLWVKITVEGDSTRNICFSSQSHRFDQILQELKLN